VRQQGEIFRSVPVAGQMLNLVLSYVLVLNSSRQIIFASSNVKELVGGRTLEACIGLRPGEALDCLHARDCVNGCGTSEFCRECGAVKAILSGLAGKQDLQECRMTRLFRDEEQSLDLLIQASPFEYKGEKFTIVSVTDTSHEKRRRVLERIFFHDAINLAGGAAGILDCLVERVPAVLRQDARLSHAAVLQLLEELESHRSLVAAERNELEVTVSPVTTVEMLEQIAAVYQRHPASAGRHIAVATSAASTVVYTDLILIKRVIGNLVKNAMEAVEDGQTVTLGCRELDGQVYFSVHNPGVIPREVQLQMFNRSFSTKGAGRGLGTYSVKLLTERYLHGQVEFKSTPDLGTEFRVILPTLMSSRDDG
jgi:signal transduction histidine kinase